MYNHLYFDVFVSLENLFAEVCRITIEGNTLPPPNCNAGPRQQASIWCPKTRAPLKVAIDSSS